MSLHKLSLLLYVAGLLSLILFFPAAGFAGRPLTIDDAEPVARGDLELELGYSYNRPRQGGKEQKWPLFSATVGILNKLEAGLNIQRAHDDLRGEPPLDGFEDLNLSIKYLLLAEKTSLPALAFSFGLKIPTASRSKGLTTGRVDQNLLLLATKNLQSLAVDLNLGYSVVDSPPGEKLKNRVLYGLALRWAAHKNWTLVGEIFGQSREAEGESNEADFQIGFQFSLLPSLVLDSGLGRSLRSKGNKFQVTVGLTWTFGLGF